MALVAGMEVLSILEMLATSGVATWRFPGCRKKRGIPATKNSTKHTRGAIQMEDMKGVILNYVKKEYLEDDSEPINFDTRLISGGIVDSFSMVSLKRFLENKYSIQIPDDQATPEAFDSVNKIASLVEAFVQKKG
jgi:acyl carrier protein